MEAIDDEFELFRARAYGRSQWQQKNHNDNDNVETQEPAKPVDPKQARRSHPRRSRLQTAVTEVCPSSYYDAEVSEAVESQKMRRHSAMGIVVADAGSHHQQLHRRHHKHRQFLPLAEASPADEDYHSSVSQSAAKSPSYGSSRSSVRSDHTSTSSTGVFSNAHVATAPLAADVNRQTLTQQKLLLQQQVQSRDSGHLSSSSSSLLAHGEMPQNGHNPAINTPNNNNNINNTTHNHNYRGGCGSAAVSQTSIASKMSTGSSSGRKKKTSRSRDEGSAEVMSNLAEGQIVQPMSPQRVDHSAFGVRFSIETDSDHGDKTNLFSGDGDMTSAPGEQLHHHHHGGGLSENGKNNKPPKAPPSRSSLDPSLLFNRQRRSSTCGVIDKPRSPMSPVSPTPSRGSAKNLAVSPAVNRRNSCFVGLTNANSRLLRPTLLPSANIGYCQLTTGSASQQQGYNSGRRNSAITYLTETSPSRSRVSLSGSACASPLMRTVSGESGSGAWRQRQSASEQLKESSLENDSGDGTDYHPRNDHDDFEECLNDSELLTTVLYQVLVIGATGVGKTTLTRQLLTSEYLANKNGSDQELALSEKTSAAVRLDGEESTVRFTEWPTANSELMEDMDACIVIYSVNDRSSFQHAQNSLAEIKKHPDVKPIFLMLVANKQDLVRNRLVTTKEGKKLAVKRRCKFLEVSALLDHKVDKVLEGVIRGTRSLRTRLNLMGSGGGDDEEGTLSGRGSRGRIDGYDDEEDGEEKTCFYRLFRSCSKMF